MTTQAEMTKPTTSNGNEPEATRGGPAYVPAVDIIEREDAYLVHADVPGASSDTLDIRYENGLLTLYAPVANRWPAPQQARMLLREYGIGGYYRQFRLGEGIEKDKIEATLTRGVLVIRLPKSSALVPRKIEVKTA